MLYAKAILSSMNVLSLLPESEQWVFLDDVTLTTQHDEDHLGKEGSAALNA